MRKVQRSPALRRCPERQVLAPYRGRSSVKASFPHDRVDVPSVPRVYDYQLGGDDNYAADRELAGTPIRTAGWLPRAAQSNRAHGAQTAAHLAGRGIRPFPDVGCGYPAPFYSAIPNAREAATMIRPDTVVLHVDHDPIVAAHPGTPRRPSRRTPRRLRRHPQDRGPARYPGAAVLVRDQPVGALLHDALPWINDDHDVHELLIALRPWLPAGSALSISHATADMRPSEVEDLPTLYTVNGLAFHPRSLAEIHALHTPWVLDEPDHSPTSRWQEDAYTRTCPTPNPPRTPRSPSTPIRTGPSCPMSSSSATYPRRSRAHESPGTGGLPTAWPQPAPTPGEVRHSGHRSIQPSQHLLRTHRADRGQGRLPTSRPPSGARVPRR